MHWLQVLQFVVLLLAANGAPVIATKVAGHGVPLDRGGRWLDGQPLFGASKTLRGLLIAVAATAAAAAVLGLGWRTGVLVGAAAMLGDLLSSFVKRRLKLAPGSRATGLDQVPESLLPALAIGRALSLSAIDITLAISIFVVADVLLSRWLYRIGVRERPY
jgi:CDP-archaeol synthase